MLNSRISRIIEGAIQFGKLIQSTISADQRIQNLLFVLRRYLTQRSVKDRLGGWGITFGLLCMIYVLSAWSDVSPSEYATRIITFTSASMPASSPASVSPEVPSKISAPALEVYLPARTKITLKFSTSFARASLREPVRSNREAGGVSRRSITIPSVSDMPEIQAKVPTPGIRRRRIIGRLSDRMTLPDARPTLERENTDLSIPSPVEDTPEIRQEVDIPEVRVFDETTLTTEDARTQQIMDWIRQNPSKIPEVIRRHMDYMDGDLASLAYTMIEGKQVNLYLLVRGGYSQLHVLMLIGETSYLFYDRGMQGEANRFRVGSVNRTGVEVSRIVSQEREITSKEAQQFYAAFIEWWENQEGN